MDLKTRLNITIQLFEIIKKLHSLGILHLDLKFSNFVMSAGLKRLLVIDFGLSRKYIRQGLLSEAVQEKPTGTHDFISRSALKREALSRKDDLESIIYMMVVLFKGKLPWSKFDTNVMYGIKTQIRAKDLCEGMPKELASIAEEVLGYKYDDVPRYDWILDTLRTCKINNKLGPLETDFVWNEAQKPPGGCCCVIF